MTNPSRRSFIGGVAALAGGTHLQGTLATEAVVPGPKSLPAVAFGKVSISRLILGGNPIDGYSHSVPKISDLMREYFTVQRTTDLILHAEEEGITAFESHYSEKVRAALTAARERGSKMHWICLTHAGEDAVLKDVLSLKPIGIAHHGNRTDNYFQADKPEMVHDYVKKIHDLGIFAGISTHCPQHLARIEDSGWENDFYMTCLYYLTRTRHELKFIYGDGLAGSDEPFVKTDPERMTKRIREARKPCLAFKLLAAGRNCNTPQAVEDAFQFTYANIKPIDAAIVGMYPVLTDEVRVNADLARKYSLFVNA